MLQNIPTLGKNVAMTYLVWNKSFKSLSTRTQEQKAPHDFKVQMSLGPHVLGLPTFMSKTKGVSSCLQPSILQFLGPRSLMS
jgi:hypothetical protein